MAVHRATPTLRSGEKSLNKQNVLTAGPGLGQLTPSLLEDVLRPLLPANLRSTPEFRWLADLDEDRLR